MAPFNPADLGPAGETLLYLVIGFFFGFALERAGFGDSRKLAAQFYFRDMTVLKVMFTAIVTAMLLLHICSGLGLVDMNLLYVNPTYLWPGILGGLLLGLGFIIGGYCPGTSLVSAATLKLDGMFFAGGVMTGILLFGETVKHYEVFFNFSGYLGRLTIPEMLGVKAAPVVLAVFLMAVGAFLGAEKLERIVNGDPQRKPIFSLKPRAIRFSLLGMAVLALAFANPPGVDVRLAQMQAKLDNELASREYHIDPAELLDMMHNLRMRIEIADVRSESDYNLFHLQDARRMDPDDPLASSWLRDVDRSAVLVVMSNGEAAAENAWKELQASGRPNVYILQGGINRWIGLYGPGPAKKIADPPSGSDTAAWRFPSALGGECELALPDEESAPKRDYTPKVKMVKPAGPLGGGCG